MTCTSCGQLITLLNSQRNGSDVCLPCAIAAAPFLHYTLKRKGQLLDDEIVCRECFDKAPDMQRVDDREYAAGYRQTKQVIPPSHDAECRQCGRTRSVTPCALCQEPKGHPYYPDLCQSHAEQLHAAIGRAYWSMATAHEQVAA